MIESSAPGLELPRGFSFWTSEEMVSPLFSVPQTAQLFYARGRRWLYGKLAEYDVSGLDIGLVRWVPVPPREGRRFSLHNIERLTHVLLAGRHIDGRRASAAITVVKATAILHGWHEEIERKERARG